MATNLDLQEQEQLDEFKSWWQKWGNLILGAVTVVLAAIAAYNGWQWYQRSQTGEAAARFDLVQKGATENDRKKVRDATGEILEKYPRSVYAPIAAFISAKMHFESGDLKTARGQLQWIVDNSREPEMQSMARLRLANVMVDEKAYDDAMKVLSEKVGAPFVAIAALLKGDILALQGKKADARAAYKEADSTADIKDTALRDRVRERLDALGES